MSMLAERKIKQKWSLNPRGKAWSEDTNKFGQKILEKMGWSHGKGLGAKEDGMLDHVKISYKNDSKGMGYKETNDQWTEHTSNFNALLQSLSGQTNTENDLKLSSLEEKSQKSKVRVHYKKFTRGKDISRYSGKDLANIFGKKDLQEAPQKSEEQEEVKESVDSSFQHNAGSMVDYFKKKLPSFGKVNGFVVGNNGVLKKESDSEEESFRGFGFKSPKKRKSNGEVLGKSLVNILGKEVLQEESQKTEEQEEVKESVNVSFTHNAGSMVDYFKKKLPNFGKTNGFVVGNKESDSEEESLRGFGFKSPKKRKSNGEVSNGTLKKIKYGNEDQIGLNNPAFDPLFNNIEVQRHVLNTIQEEDGDEAEKKTNKLNGCNENRITESINGKKKKKSSLKSDDSTSQEIHIKKKKKKKREESRLDEDKEECQQNSFEVKRKKKSKDNNILGIDNPNCDDMDHQNNSYVNENFEVKRKKKNDENLDHQNSCVNENFEVKRKKKKKEIEAMDNPSFNDNDCRTGYVNEDFEVKRKKKKKKDKADDLALDNPNYNDSLEYQNEYVDEKYEVKRKNKTLAIDNPSFSDLSVDDTTKIKKNKKSKKKERREIENSSALEVVDVPDANEPELDLILNVTATPITPKVDSNSVTSSSTKRSSVKRRKSVRFSNVTEERIIPSNDIQNRNDLFDINSKVIANGLKDMNGMSNLAFNNHQIQLEENIDEISKKIDGFQAEIENDMNEAKVCKFIGEVGAPDGENEKLPEGTRLKFKYASFGKTPFWLRKNTTSNAKSGYKHLIKGDIVVGFKNTNLHEIKGYAVRSIDQ